MDKFPIAEAFAFVGKFLKALPGGINAAERKELGKSALHIAEEIFGQSAEAAERERCAKLVESYKTVDPQHSALLDKIAADIRNG